VKELLSIGIQADILLCRTDRFLSRDVKSKIAAFCNVEDRAVITAKDVASIYECPLVFHQEGVDALALKYLHIEAKEADLSKWEDLVRRAYNPKDEVSIAIVGKYVEYEDSYKSLKEALTHGALAKNLKLKVTWIEAEGLESKHEGDESYKSQLAGFDGILVPGGFGKRGIEGMLNAIRYARENKVPYFGICLGMQTACIEYARNVCGLAHANSSEFDPAAQHRIIYKLRELTGVEEMGGTMRLGAWSCILQPDSLAAKAYTEADLSSRTSVDLSFRPERDSQDLSFRPERAARSGEICGPADAAQSTTAQGQSSRDDHHHQVLEISERHRHRYEFNREYEALLTGAGLSITGTTPDATYVEIIEIPNHPFFLGCQFHPEFKSKPLEPHPLFRAFIEASYDNRVHSKPTSTKSDLIHTTRSRPFPQATRHGIS
jgi:CTP synthase